MNTPSHIILQAALSKGKLKPTVLRKAFLLGSFMPDIPLYLLSTGGAIYYKLKGIPMSESMPYMFDELFFNNPYWIFLHNFLHSPSLLIIFFMLTLLSENPKSKIIRWFVIGCFVHTLADIPVHHNDGPLLFFPFDWHTRFLSPLSYWDPKYYGSIFWKFEFALDIILLVYLFKDRITKLIKKFQ